ncbi:bifunctional diguanylate cyclase/phosphodiesterase [Inhella proteolytica]|uniref:bifunctional diguanylate cyclase/phosphodiesterase n=1 Tax=Inhella proteolytica TaxID=2795029 RepID=UPI001E58E81D|nr:EAL domain-containing protein [Inhella proteolytica]
MHRSHRTEALESLPAVGLLALLLLVALVLPASETSRGLAQYAPLHTVLEVFSITVSGLVFAIGWATTRHVRSLTVATLGCLFLGVALLDLGHTLSYQGMPDFITASGSEKAINFWLAARSLAVGGLLLAAFSRWHLGDTPRRYPLLIGVLLLVLLVHLVVLFHPQLLPRTFVEGQGLTGFKRAYEYALIVLCLLAAGVLLRRLRAPRRFNASALLAAALIMAMSEFFFTLYGNVTDVYNLLGHVYKVVAYGFLYWALFIDTVHQPYQALASSEHQLSATLAALPDLLFEMDTNGRYLAVHTPQHAGLAAPAETLVGRSVQEVMPPESAQICLEALRVAALMGHAQGQRISLPLPDGLRHFELSVARKEGEPGREPVLLVLSRDVTTLAEQQLALEQESRLNQILLGLPALADGLGEEDFLRHALPLVQHLNDSAWVCLRVYEAGQNVARLDLRSDAAPPDWEALAWTAQQTRQLQHSVPSRPPLLALPALEQGQVRLLLGVGRTQAAYGPRDLEGLRILAESLWRLAARRRQELRMRQQQQELDYFFNANRDLFAIWDRQGQLQRVNGALAQLLGLRAGELQGHSLQAHVHPEDRAATEAVLHTLGQDGEADFEHRCLAPDGSAHPVEWRVRVLDDLVYASGRDVGERRAQDAAIRTLSTALTQSPYAVVVTDAQGAIEYANPAFEAMTGYSEAEVMGSNPRLLQSGRTPASTYREMWDRLHAGEPWRGEFINRRKDGSEYTEEALIYPVREPSGRVVNYLAHKEDVSAKRAAVERIQQLSHFDQLTGLPNPALFAQRAQALLTPGHEPVTLIWLDLDNFKAINDSLGHTVGDLLLRETAHRLNGQLREHELLARQSGDAFTLLLPGCSADAAAAHARQLLAALEPPVPLQDQELVIGASLGLAQYPQDGQTLEALLMCAETAMYRVKQEGRNGFRFFDPGMQEHSARALALSASLRHALARQELTVVYQPQQDLHGGGLYGAEALLRWHSAQWGPVSPAEFIPLAESSGLIVPIGDWVLRTVVQQLAQWDAEGLPPLRVAVNLSAVQFAQPHLAQTVQRLLHESGLGPRRIELELTEAVALRDPEAARRTMEALSQAGMRLAIDDFGTGYSSMSYLKRFAVDLLKIDRSFVRELHSNPDDQAIATAIIQMARSLGLHTLAEGVETEAQREFLRARGCDAIQGYLYARPLSASAFADFVRTQPKLS